MLGNYLKTSYRLFRRAKLYSSITIAGLAIGLAVAMLICLWIQNQLSYDRYNADAGRIYRVTTHFKMGDFEESLATSAPPIAAALRTFPEVKFVTGLTGYSKDAVVAFGQRRLDVPELAFADPSFFKVFSLLLLEGDRSSVLSAPNTVVLASSVAKLMFSGSDPVGKTITLRQDGIELRCVVTGVMQDIPQDSHFHFKALVSSSTFYNMNPGYRDKWYYSTAYTYFMLKPQAHLSSVGTELSAEIRSHLGADFIKHNSWGIGFQRLTGIHLHSHLAMELEQNGNMQTLMIFLSIAFFVLLVGIVNFLSLSTARFTDRAREIGIRKVVGADRKQLFVQFLGEAIAIAMFSTIVAVSLVEMCLPFFGRLAGAQLSLSVPDLVAILLGGVAVGAVSGSYPAFLMSSYRPVGIPGTNSLPKRNAAVFRKILVVTQFVVAITAMISGVVIASQLDYLRNKDLGFDKKDIVAIPLQHRGMEGKYYFLKQQLDEVPGVESITASMGGFGFADFKNEIKYHGNVLFKCSWLGVDYGFLKTMKIALVSGRTFSKDFPSDTAGAVIVNEAAAARLAALGVLDKKLELGIYVNRKPNMHVIGVTKDFNYLSMYNPIQPFFLILNPRRPGWVYVRISSRDIKSTVGRIRKVWDQIDSGYPFEFSFLDSQLNSSYVSDRRLGRIVGIAALLSIFIGAIGIFGLASYSIERRVKEVGIRKVLGASSHGLVVLLSGEFAILVLAANIIAWPLAFYLTKRWLDNFAFHIGTDPLAFTGVAAIVFVVAVGTVAFKAARAARANPVESLRYE